MNIILLSGGSGKRLWPLSNDVMSKQFLQLLPSEEVGKKESMVQRVCRQIVQTIPEAKIVISTNIVQESALERQIENLTDIVIEPERRNTFPAILLACAYYYYQKELSLNEPVIVLPIDVFADEEYFISLKRMEAAACLDSSNIVLMGTTPTYPSEKYGYIIPDGNIFKFEEKPQLNRAIELLSINALWNCGVFAFRLGYVINILTKRYNVNSFDGLLSIYNKLPNESFDRIVVEKEGKLGVIKYVGKWKDLGTWNTLTEEMESKSIGKDIIITETCKNTHVLNMLDLPVIAIGLKDSVIVASHDGILVSDKNESSYLKNYADQILKIPMYESKTWGKYRVLEHIANEDGGECLIRRVSINAHQVFRYNNSSLTSLFLIKGSAIYKTCGNSEKVSAGSVIKIQSLQEYVLETLSAVELIEVQMRQETQKCN